MKVLKEEHLVMCDVDDTLIMWVGANVVGIKLIANPLTGEHHYVLPHKGHIKILKDRYARGSKIVVWSAGGYAWAEAVVEALGLTQYVSLIMSKPMMYIDDKKADEILGERCYVPYGSGYGES